MKTPAACALLLWGAALCLASGQGTTFVLTTSFDTTFDATLTAPFIGAGTFSYDAPTPLPDGTYSWNSFANLRLSMTVGTTTFDESTLQTPTDEVYVEIRGGSFYFSNVSGLGQGPNSGSADFITGSFLLSTEPRFPGGGMESDYGGGADAPLYFATVDSLGDIDGTYGVPSSAIPEPAEIGVVLAGLTGGYAVLRRRRSF